VPSSGLVRLTVVLRLVTIAWFSRVEHVEPQLQLLLAADPDGARERHVEHALEAAAQVVGARLEADAADRGPRERRRRELAERIAAAARPGSPRMRTRPP
jgi:hypothetical protein